MFSAKTPEVTQGQNCSYNSVRVKAWLLCSPLFKIIPKQTIPEKINERRSLRLIASFSYRSIISLPTNTSSAIVILTR